MAARRGSRRSSSARNSRKQQIKVRESFWTRWPIRRKHGICIGILFAAAIIFYAPYHLDGLSFIGHDVIQWRAGAESIIEARERFDEEPLWATNMFGGMPAYVISHARQFPHLDDIVLGALEFIYPVAEYWLMFLGAYVLFILLGFRPLSAVVGAVIIGFTTYIPIIVAAGHHTKFVAYAIMPWVMVGYTLITRHPRWRWLGVAVFLIALSLHLKQSHPQVTYYFFYLMLAWWLLDVVRAVRSGKGRFAAQSTGLLVAAGLVAVLAVIQPYWAMLEYSPHSIRGSSDVETATGLDIDYAFVWSQGWGELLTLAIPDLYGGSDAYWGPKPMTGGPHYFGAISLLLLLIGLFRGRHELKWLFFGVGVLTLLFSLGKHFPLLNETMFAIVPGFDKFRTPEMWLIVTVFGFTLVALTGIEWLADRLADISSKDLLKELYLPLGLGVGFALLMVVATPTFFSFQKPGEVEQIARQIARQAQASPSDQRVVQAAEQYVREELVPERLDRASEDSVRMLIFVGLAAGLIVLGVLGKISFPLAVMGLILLTAGDMMTVGSRYINKQGLVPRGVEPVEVIESYRRPLDTFLEDAVAAEEGWSWRVFPMLDNPFNNAIPAYFYPSIGGYTGAKIGRYQDVIDHALFTGDLGLNLGLLRMLNVRYVTHGAELPLPGFRVAHRGEGGVVNEITNALPKAFFVDSVATVSSPREALTFVSNGFDPSAVAVVESDHPPATAGSSGGGVRVTTYRPRLIELETNGSGFLVLSEIYYEPGWRALVDGTEVPIHKTNYILRGIEVPEGSSRIRFEFNPTSYTVGKPISTGANIVMWLLVIGAVVQTVRSERRVGNDEDAQDESTDD